MKNRPFAFAVTLLLAPLAAGCPAKRNAGAPDAGGDPCVAACIRQNQMRAVSAEQIEADCKKECAEQPPE